MTPPPAGARAGVRLPCGVVHTDPGCWHIRGRTVQAECVPPSPGEVCRDCRRRQERRLAASRAAHEAAVRAQAREDVRRDPDAVIESVIALSALSRRGAG
jgi:hypothetical protein